MTINFFVLLFTILQILISIYVIALIATMDKEPKQAVEKTSASPIIFSEPRNTVPLQACIDIPYEAAKNADETFIDSVADRLCNDLMHSLGHYISMEHEFDPKTMNTRYRATLTVVDTGEDN